MRLSDFCFTIAGLAALTGMALGIHMGIHEDFTLAPAHAHLNLLGWVTMALYGLYHRGVARPTNRLAWLQVGCGAAGFPLMSGGLAAYLATGEATFAPLVIAGSLLMVASMALFVVIVIKDAIHVASAVPADANQRAFGW